MQNGQILEVKAGEGYLVEITPGLLSDAPKLAGRLSARLGLTDPAVRAVIVTDSNVGPLYAENVQAALEAARPGASAGVIAIPAGEQSKTPAELVRVLEAMAGLRLTRKDAVIALGGGVVGDLAGLAAALYMRGIRCLQMPTSLLAMVDSSVGGKTAVDLEAGKNLMGVFSQPVGVLIDPEVLRTLPAREIYCGWGEIIKYAGLDPDVLAAVRQELGSGEDGSGLAPLPSVDLIARSIDVKRRIVSEDEKESGARRLLNLGHTAGHAVETASCYALSHGASVAIGMHILTKALVQEGKLPRAMLEDLEALLLKAGLPASLPPELLARPDLDFSTDKLLAIARHDKKSAGSGVNLVLPVAPGRAEVKKVSWEDFRAMLETGLR